MQPRHQENQNGRGRGRLLLLGQIDHLLHLCRTSLPSCRRSMPPRSRLSSQETPERASVGTETLTGRGGTRKRRRTKRGGTTRISHMAKSLDPKKKRAVPRFRTRTPSRMNMRRLMLVRFVTAPTRGTRALPWIRGRGMIGRHLLDQGWIDGRVTARTRSIIETRTWELVTQGLLPTVLSLSNQALVHVEAQ